MSKIPNTKKCHFGQFLTDAIDTKKILFQVYNKCPENEKMHFGAFLTNVVITSFWQFSYECQKNDTWHISFSSEKNTKKYYFSKFMTRIM